MNVFVDSDVIISSLLSDKGASYQLLRRKTVSLYVSNISQQELEVVIERLDISKEKLHHLINEYVNIVNISTNLEQIKKQYRQYVSDINDAHVVAGAHTSKADFLITYNVKDFKVNGIKEDFGVKILTPGIFIQYLRSK